MLYLCKLLLLFIFCFVHVILINYMIPCDFEKSVIFFHFLSFSSRFPLTYFTQILHLVTNGCNSAVHNFLDWWLKSTIFSTTKDLFKLIKEQNRNLRYIIAHKLAICWYWKSTQNMICNSGLFN